MKPTGAQLEKARTFWSRKAALRKQPMHCGRCGTHLGTLAEQPDAPRQCAECRAWAADYRARKRSKVVAVEAGMLAKLERRVGNLEHYFARLSEVHSVAYNRGYRAGVRKHRASAEKAGYVAAMPEISLQEAAEISHEFTR